LLVSVATGLAPCIKPGSGKSFKDCPECPEMVVVSAGSFTMGSPAGEPERDGPEGPQHEVRIAKPFAAGKFVVTVGEYLACVQEGGCQPPEWQERGSKSNIKTGSGDYYKKLGEALTDAVYPIVGVSWSDAKAYAEWLSQKIGRAYRLLSEAEREYVTRAGTTTPFWWGKSITPEQANYDGNYTYAGGGRKGEYRQKTVPVKSFRPNSWGLYQVHGNVWEWAEDCWEDSYNGAPGDGSARTTGDCKLRVLRGGSWDNSPWTLRAACRSRDGEANRGRFIGFRVARTLD
jgi:formylglycine-generating enzyme required for sulfatase activity